jgi:ferredoxin
MATNVIEREIITIDEDLCDGCGLCIPACKEGALAIVDGKAKLVSEVYCDGMGSCLGECPQDAITIERRPAAAFDEEAVSRHIAATQPEPTPAAEPAACGCPSSVSRSLRPEPAASDGDGQGPLPASQLRNWPVELMLAPPQAPYFENARLLICADCVPFAYAGFHQSLLKGRVLLVGCPKLDDAEHYRRKLAQILATNAIESIEVAFMEVPCCLGLVQLVRQALADSGKELPAEAVRIGIQDGEQMRVPLSELPF